MPRKQVGTSLLPSERAVLAAYLDTLLPGDGASPAASALDLGAQIASGALAQAKYHELLVWGARWLHHRAMEVARSGFASLPEERRAVFVREAEQADPRTPQRIFFELTRQDAFGRYYANARTWPGIGYAGPPQPRGFPDHARAPRTS